MSSPAPDTTTFPRVPGYFPEPAAAVIDNTGPAPLEDAPASPASQPEPVHPAPPAPADSVPAGGLLRWLRSEPVRVRAWALLVAVGSYLVYRGAVNDLELQYWLKMGAALCFGGVVAEDVRGRVSPVVTR
jgi:hypothetical protein